MPDEDVLPLVPIDVTPPAPSAFELFKEQQNINALKLATRDLLNELDPIDDGADYTRAHCLFQALNLF